MSTYHLNVRMRRYRIMLVSYIFLIKKIKNIRNTKNRISAHMA